MVLLRANKYSALYGVQVEENNPDGVRVDDIIGVIWVWEI